MTRDPFSGVSAAEAMIELTQSLSTATSHAEATNLFIAAIRRLHGHCSVLVASVRSLTAGQFRIIRWIGLDGSDVVAQPADFEPSRLSHLPIVEGQFIGNLMADARPRIIRMSPVQDAMFSAHFTGPGLIAAAPMFDNGKFDGWVTVFQSNPKLSDEESLTDIAATASALGAAYTRLALAERLRHLDGELQKEVDQISRLQRAMLPTMLPAVPGLDLAAGYKTFDRAGGDYYDVFPLGGGSERRSAGADDPWGILVADASGHGPSATVVVSMLSGVLHAYAGRPTSPAEFLDYLNRHLYARDFCGDFVTAIFAIFEPSSRKLTWAHAGHNPPLLRDAQTGAVRVLDDPGGVPLGIQDRVDACDHALQFEPGQLMLMYTDGVVDERDDDDKPFGLDQLVQRVAADTTGPAGLVETLSRALDDHQGVTRPEDDQTMLAFRLMA